jgi:hypothetical protein
VIFVARYRAKFLVVSTESSAPGTSLTLSDDFWEGFSLLLAENGTTLVLQN